MKQGDTIAEGATLEEAAANLQAAQEAYAAGLMIGLRLADSAPLLRQARKDWDAVMAIKPFWR